MDNDARRVDFVRLRQVACIDAGTRGTYYFDTFRAASRAAAEVEGLGLDTIRLTRPAHGLPLSHSIPKRPGAQGLGVGRDALRQRIAGDELSLSRSIPERSGGTPGREKRRGLDCTTTGRGGMTQPSDASRRRTRSWRAEGRWRGIGMRTLLTIRFGSPTQQAEEYVRVGTRAIAELHALALLASFGSQAIEVRRVGPKWTWQLSKQAR